VTHFVRANHYSRILVPVDVAIASYFDRMNASVDFKMRTMQLEREADVRKFMNQTRLGEDEIVLVHFKGKVYPQWRGGVFGGVR